MSGFTAAQKFGWDAPHRILTTTNFYVGALDMPLPGEPIYPTVLPFVSASGLNVVGGGLTPVIQTWESAPSQLDLTFYEGDDITVPLTFQDPGNTALDMSEASEWDWFAQIRTGHGPLYTLVGEFFCDAVYAPPAPPDQPLGVTNVKMVLPRQDNILAGTFFWDLVSVSPVPGHPDETQPDYTPGTSHTWLWGEVTVLSRVTHPDATWPPGSEEEVTVTPAGTDGFLAITTGTGFTVGPNGRIP